MNLKRNSLIVLIIGLLISAFGFVLPIVYASHNGANGIIGGAGAPTYGFIVSSLFHGLPFVLILTGICLVISSGFCLIFSKTVKLHCNLSSSAISMGLAGLSALGLYCVFLWFAIVSFGKMEKYPFEYPLSILFGVISLVAFLFLIALYFKVRKKHWSVKGVIIDVLTSIVYLPAFFFMISYLHAIIS